jgi:uncharacterized protein YggT (Ycf19 family)
MTLNLLAAVRYTVLAAAALALVAATFAGAVEIGRIHPHSSVGRAITRTTDPVIQPVRRTVTVGGSLRYSAAFWFGVTAIVTAAFTSTFLEWLLFPKRGLPEDTRQASRRTAGLAITIGAALLLGLVIIGLWGALAGAPRAAWWMRPFSLPTAWAVDRLQDTIPRIALLNLAAGALYGALRLGRGLAIRSI